MNTMSMTMMVVLTTACGFSLVTGQGVLTSSSKNTTTAKPSTGKVCTMDCIIGWVCQDGACVPEGGEGPCGPTIMTSNGPCSTGYQCVYMSQVGNQPVGYCLKQDCGGTLGTCTGNGYWCDLQDSSNADSLGVCTNLVCPQGCQTWFNGCQTCGCSGIGETSFCDDIACLKYTTPRCDMPDECDTITAHLDALELGTVDDMVSMYGRLDPQYQQMFIQKITPTAAPTQTPTKKKSG